METATDKRRVTKKDMEAVHAECINSARQVKKWMILMSIFLIILAAILISIGIIFIQSINTITEICGIIMIVGAIVILVLWFIYFGISSSKDDELCDEIASYLDVMPEPEE